MNMHLTDPQSSRSTLVTVVAWIFIVLAGFSTFMSVLQNVMISTLFPIDQMQREAAASGPDMPAFARFMLGHIRYFFAGFLAVSTVTLVAAIGLLNRKNWARVLFIAVLGLGIAWNLAAIALQQWVVGSMVPPGAPADVRETIQVFLLVIRLVSALTAIGISVLFGWLIKRLASIEVKREFGAA